MTLDLYRELLRSRFLSELPPDMTAEGILRAAVSLGPLDEASLWQADAGSGLVCLSLVGRDAVTRRVRACARELLLDGRSRDNDRGHVHAVPVFRWGATYAGLVLRARPANREAALAFAGEAASELTAVLERERLLGEVLPTSARSWRPASGVWFVSVSTSTTGRYKCSRR